MDNIGKSEGSLEGKGREKQDKGVNLMSNIIVRKKKRELKDLNAEEKWNILKEYCTNSLSNKEIGEMYQLEPYSVDALVSKVYKRLQNVREIRMLIGTSYDPKFSEIMRKKYVDTESINQGFLDLLSHPDDPLTDNEILFCEFLIEYGMDEDAIRKSKLDVGLKRDQKASYLEGCKLRAFYLKKKPNIASYITKSRQANLGVLENYGKDYIQSQLITIIDQLGNIGDKSSLTHQLKALESLARTVGAFEDKVVIETANGDDALDRLIKRAKEAHAAKSEEEPKPVAYVDGQEIYESSGRDEHED